MPFTPSHMAAVLPFARTPLLPAALAIGAMEPDLFFFLPIPVSREFTHSWLGVFTLDLAVSLLAFALWQLVLRAPMVDFAPAWVRERLPHAGSRPGSRGWPVFAALLVASILIGSTTHVIWDSFTHDSAFIRSTPLLFDQMGPLRVFKWLQHVSSALGIALLVAFVLRWRRHTPAGQAAPTRLTARSRTLEWLVVLGLGFVVALAIWIGGIASGTSPLENTLVYTTVVVGIAVAGLLALIVLLFWHRRPILQ
jgi:hypothetical protein